jgi:hypothetical protein
MAGHVFISHTSKDDAFVKALRERLEAHGIETWVDSRELRGGSKLAPEIEEAIETARAFIVVLSVNTINSPWVRKEIKKALEVEAEKKDDGYRVIPVMLPGVGPAALELWFEEEPVGITVELKTGGMDEALIPILAALGERAREDHVTIHEIPARPVEELILRLQDPKIEEQDGKRRATATATLIYEPADEHVKEIESIRYKFTAPLGAIEHEEIRWSLEEYLRWPVGVFKTRAERTEVQLPEWGKALYQAALSATVTQEALRAWETAGGGAARRFSVWVDAEPVEGTPKEEIAATQEAASALLALP